MVTQESSRGVVRRLLKNHYVCHYMKHTRTQIWTTGFVLAIFSIDLIFFLQFLHLSHPISLLQWPNKSVKIWDFSELITEQCTFSGSEFVIGIGVKDSSEEWSLGT